MQSEQRLHPLSFLFAIGSNLRASLIPILVAVFAARSYDAFFIFLGIPVAAWAFVRYLSYRYVFAEDDLVIRTGFLFRNERHIPYGRIHNLNAIQNPFHRLFGVVEVRLETAGGNEPEARLQVLSLKAMEEMRQHIRREKGQPALAEEVLDEDSALAMEEAPQAQQSRTLLHLPWRELVVHGIIENRGLVVVGAAMGLAYELGLFGGDDKPFWSVNVQAQAIRDLVSDFTGTGILIAALGLLFVVLLRLFSVGLAIVKLYGFRLQKSGRDLTLTGGLFTRFTTTIPLHRIQILTVREKPLQRLFKRAEVRAQTVGNTDESKESVLGSQHLAPLIHRRQLPQLLKEVQPEIDLEAIQWQSVAPKAKRRIRRKGYFVVALISAAGSFYLGWWALMLLAALVPLAVVNARLQMKHLGYAEHGGVLLFRSGWMWRNLSMARTSKIQAVTMSQSPFDRRYRMSRLRVDTAGAGQTGHILEIPYLDWDVARSLYNSLGADAAHTAFRW